MNYDEDVDVEWLLSQPEGPTLDFKREQYRFDGASDGDKSELLKDVLSFANAPRHATAYIVIGVRELQAQNEVTGVHEHLDDAKLQQFVNTKTQRPVTFSYRPIAFRGIALGIISIPVQTAPFFIRNDFGRLKKGTVYVRQGSSTAVADPDEIIRIREASATVQRAKDAERARAEWRVIERQAVESVSVSFMHRREMDVDAFMQYLHGVRISIAFGDTVPGGRLSRLGFRRISQTPDQEAAFGLVVTDQREQSESRSVSLYKLGQGRSSAPEKADAKRGELAPNEISQVRPAFVSGPTYVVAVTMHCDGWSYTTSNDHDWTEPSARACGVVGRLNWKVLGHDIDVKTIRDLGRIDSVRVELSPEIDLRSADKFELAFSTVGGQFPAVRLDRLRYSRREDSGAWTTSIPGHQMYAGFEQDYIERRCEMLDDDRSGRSLRF